MNRIVLKGVDDTAQFANKLAAVLTAGDVVCLHGDLGAGKTTMTKSIGKALGVEQEINSPTFTLINEYSGRLKLYHFDTYRLSDGIELFDLGFDDYFFGNGVCVVEWPEKIARLIPENAIHIYISRGAADDERVVSFDDERLEGHI